MRPRKGWDGAQMREMLSGLRADHLLAASLAGTPEGLRDVIASAIVRSESPSGPGKTQVKALGNVADDVSYTPVTPCRLLDTRGTFAAVYQGDGTPSHPALPFASNEIRTYTVQGNNNICLAQLPAGLGAAAVQLQVFGMPTSAASGDIEILPQGATFGTTATMVYVGGIAFNTVSTNAKINTSDNQISVQVRGGGANLAIDVVGYFRKPTNCGAGNSVTGVNGALAGGVGNNVSNNYAAIIGGSNNLASGPVSTVGGGQGNAAIAQYAFVGGGFANTAGASFSSVVGGSQNQATGIDSFVAGGDSNVASGQWSSVIGGADNTASGAVSVAAGSYATAAIQTASSGMAGARGQPRVFDRTRFSPW